jgi:hypothetical protein
MPSDWVLKQIAFPPPKEHFLAMDGKLPRISYHNQLRIRRACVLAGVNCNSIGLPNMPEDPIKFNYNMKGSKRPVDLQKRAMKIEENMKQMPARIAAWKAERAKIKLALKPDMPF